MRTTAFIATAPFLSVVQAQTPLSQFTLSEDKKIIYENVITADSTPARTLFRSAKRWFVENYRSAQDVIQLDDPDNNELIGRAYFTIPIQMPMIGAFDTEVWHLIKISCKEDRYRYSISEFSVVTYNDGIRHETLLEDWHKGRSAKRTAAYYSDVDQYMKATIAGLVQFMRSSSENDW